MKTPSDKELRQLEQAKARDEQRRKQTGNPFLPDSIPEGMELTRAIELALAGY